MSIGGLNDLLESFKKKNTRSLARLISKIENEDPDKDYILKNIYQMTGKAHVLGVTGSPGAGKSSLVDRITLYLRKKGYTVGIIAVDPTSPFSGGALLGDRIRMQSHAVDKGVYIRSMGTRGNLGGLARAAGEAVKLLDAFGFDWVIVETVGVGQAELDIMHVADTTLVVLTPGAGDSIQTIKAGIMEIADVFVVNKCDLQGADRVVSEINQMLDLRAGDLGWHPPVVKVSTLDDRGLDHLMESVETHAEYLRSSGELEKSRNLRVKRETLEAVDFRWHRIVGQQADYKDSVMELLDKVAIRETDPYTAAEEILKLVIKNPGSSGEGADLKDKGQEILGILENALNMIKEAEGYEKNMTEYSAYLHGQIYGLAVALRIIFPGPGNFGERAAMAIRPVMTEHSCKCDDGN
ncbi:MAG: methylmalonyl Co-A mutase-associated GTPase MeaB [Bacillota bacterium]